MAQSFLQRLFSQIPSPAVDDRSGLESQVPNPEVQNSQPVAERKSLFAFVDLKDPFTPGEVAGEELPGPILSMMSALHFDSIFLFHTPHTREKALATRDEVSRRYPDCSVVVQHLPVSDPKDYSPLMAFLWRAVRKLMLGPFTGDSYVCVSSGTAEMRAAWFVLTALGVLPAKLLQVGSPAQPLFGEANVKEVQISTGDWQAIRDLAMPSAYFRQEVGALRKPVAHSVPRPTSSWPRGEPKEPAPTAGALKLTTEQLASLRLGKQSTRDGTQDQEKDAQAEARKEELSDIDSEHDAYALGARSPRIDREALPVPGLDNALRELGIHVGSAVLRYSAEQACIAAESHLPVLLLGETGTGKERFAHLVHRLSPRVQNALVAINCAAIPESIAESYLFGHTKGAFSGASSDKKGMFESADRSTLFFDEIGELSLEVQAKLLRVIQDGVVQRLGSTAARKVDVRIIAASNRDLSKEVSAGRFREDLYFRLEVVQIKLPALRDRRGEIPELALALLRQINQRRHKPRQLTKAALLRLEHYAWPGNVRQLSNVLERSVLYARRDIIDAEDLIIIENHAERDPFAALPEPSQGFLMEEYLSQVRKQLYLRAIAACHGNQAEAAEMLGVSKQAVSKFVASQTDKAS